MLLSRLKNRVILLYGVNSLHDHTLFVWTKIQELIEEGIQFDGRGTLVRYKIKRHVFTCVYNIASIYTSAAYFCWSRSLFICTLCLSALIKPVQISDSSNGHLLNINDKKQKTKKQPKTRMWSAA